MSGDLLDVVPTRAALLKQTSFKATVFDSKNSNPRPQKKEPIQKPEESEDDEDDIFSDKPRKRKPLKKEDDTEFDIKKARHEVINFALSGFRSEKHKKKTEIALAVKLGAKPPPKAYKNYKQLLQEKQNLKNVREQRKKFHQLGKTQTGLASVKCKSKTQKGKDNKKRAPVSNISNHYGVPNPKFKSKKKK